MATKNKIKFQAEIHLAGIRVWPAGIPRAVIIGDDLLHFMPTKLHSFSSAAAACIGLQYNSFYLKGIDVRIKAQVEDEDNQQNTQNHSAPYEQFLFNLS